MEDSNISEPPHSLNNMQKLKQSISELKYDPQGQYFALSVDFLNHPSKYVNAVPSSPKNNINSQLYEGNSPFSYQLKQALRYSVDYVVIDQKMMLEIQLNYNCSRIKIGRNKNLGQRWILYKELVPYLKFSKHSIQSKDQSQSIICKRIEVFSYNNLEDIRLIILKKQNLPDYHRGKMWILIGQFPKNPSKLRQKIGQRNNLIPYSMLINDPQLFKFKRKYKQFTILLQQQQSIILPLEIKCYFHPSKLAHFTCICKHQRSFVCDKLCYQDNNKHNKRCIYVPKKQQYFNGVPAKIKKQLNPDRRIQPGLYNQRNMCFFNTIIQCLAHVKKLSQYFLSKNQYKQLNYWNNDGTFGQIAQQYGNFIRKLNDQASDKCHMSLFTTVGRWNPSYANKNQHDSHQFLIKILDWLKEDLNANQLKPLYKHIQNVNKEQEELILQTETIHKARNDSIIQKIMQGVQKSVIKCVICGYLSLTFDYFLTIQLPMARETKIQIQVKESFIYYVSTANEQKKITRFKLFFQKDETIQSLKKQARSIIPRLIDYDFQFYKVTAYSAELIKNDNYYEILSVPQSRKEVIFCVQKYKIGYGRQTIPVNLVFRGIVEGLPPFCRPIFIPNVMEVQIIYIKMLSIIMKCKKTQSETNVQNYFHKYFETQFFPFELTLKNPKEQRILITRKKQYKKYNFEPGSILFFNILNNKDFNFAKLNTYVSTNTQPTKQMKNKSVLIPPTIEDCLKLYCKKQEIQDGRWQCSNCKMKRPATKTLFFKKLPNIVILSINRFKQIYSLSSYTTQFNKNQNLIEYGPQLNMGKFTQNQTQQRYRLLAVANHLRIDESQKDVREMDGHYYAAIKTDKGWLRFDDQDVTITTEQKVLNNNQAYILFYQKIIQT